MTQSPLAQLISVNVGLPRSVAWKGRTVQTGIFKQPVIGPVVARRLNLDGDRQADLTVHGGEDKAVYVYPAEHYTPWTRGLTEEDVWVGERWQVGEAVLVVRQPRQPCYKLGVRFGRDDVLRRFVQSRRTGWYLAVEREGVIAAGDAIVRLDRPTTSLSIAVVSELLFAKEPNEEYVRIAAGLPGLAEGLRMYFQQQLA